MAVQHILNILILTLVLASRSFDAVQAAACQRALVDYFSNWKLLEVTGRALLNQDKELQHDDVKTLFMPICDMNGNYATKQCFMNSYCWCSDPRGNLLSGTFQKGTAEKIDCTRCILGNSSYTSGEYFKIPETCEACKCDNREVICQKYFCSNETKLSPQELMELKLTFLIVLYVQHESRNARVRVVIVREEYLAQVPLDLALSHIKQRLHWKFNMLDKNQDENLNKEYEFNNFMKEIRHFVQSRQVYDTIFSLIDKDDDKLISKSEWMNFFDNINMTPSSDGSGSATVDDEESPDASGEKPEEVATRSVKSSRSLPEVMKEFVVKLRKQQRLSHSENKYF